MRLDSIEKQPTGSIRELGVWLDPRLKVERPCENRAQKGVVACRCGLGDETAENLLLHCPLETERRQWRRGTRLNDLVSEPSSAATIAKWIIQSGRLGQFQLASKLLYGGESSVGS